MPRVSGDATGWGGRAGAAGESSLAAAGGGAGLRDRDPPNQTASCAPSTTQSAAPTPRSNGAGALFMSLPPLRSLRFPVQVEVTRTVHGRSATVAGGVNVVHLGSLERRRLQDRHE